MKNDILIALVRKMLPVFAGSIGTFLFMTYPEIYIPLCGASG